MEIESDPLSYKCPPPQPKLDHSFSYVVHPPPMPQISQEPMRGSALDFTAPPPQYLKNTLLLGSGFSESDHSLRCMCCWRCKIIFFLHYSSDSGVSLCNGENGSLVLLFHWTEWEMVGKKMGIWKQGEH